MPIIHRVKDLDGLLDGLKESPVFINDLINLTTEDRIRIQNELMTTYKGEDKVSLIPSCSCGKTKSVSLLGHICPYCNTPVKNDIDMDVRPLFWLRAPKGIKALPNPDMWTKLTNYFTKSGFNCIEYCCGIKPPHEKLPKFFNKLACHNLPSSYNEFIDRFDETMSILFSIKQINVPKKREVMMKFIMDNRKLMFCKAVPLPNKVLIVLEKTHMGNYYDKDMISGLGSMLSLVGIDTLTHLKNKEKRTVNCINKLCDFYSQYYVPKFQKKEALYRTKVFASRVNYTFRAVITSITKPHTRDVILAPWSHSVTVFRHHLMNKLLKSGMSHNSAVGYLNEHTDIYSELLHKFLLEIKEESNDDLATIIQRN